MTIIGQTEKIESNKESWYFKAGGSYFTQTASTEFPVVEVNCQTEMYMWGLYRIIN
jgi:hypothetical protein